MGLRILTGIWGDERYIDWFERGCARSLSWPRNREALKDATWLIATEVKYAQRAADAAYKTGISNLNLFVFLESNNLGYRMQFSKLHISEMQTCLRDKSMFMFALPDYIFGDGTIPNLIKMASIGPDTCVAVANTRSLPVLLDEMSRHVSLVGCMAYSDLSTNKIGGETWLTNQKLFSMSWPHKHSSWSEAELGKSHINALQGGVAWQELERGMIAVTHRLPSTYLAQFRPDDHDMMRHHGDFSAWDHELGAKFVSEGRQRVVGSSEACFITEITRAEDNCAILEPVNLLNPTKFHRDLIHNTYNGNTQIIFTKE